LTVFFPEQSVLSKYIINFDAAPSKMGRDQQRVDRRSTSRLTITHGTFNKLENLLSLSFLAGNPEEDIVTDSISFISRRKHKKSSGVVKTFFH